MRLRVSLMAVLLLVVGCAPVDGTAVKATGAADVDGVDVSQLDTGNYPVSAGPPFASAGQISPTSGNLIEAHRIAAHTTGPWQVNSAFRQRGSVLTTSLTMPLYGVETLKSTDVVPDEAADIIGAHGFVAGFSTFRVSSPDPDGSMFNMVLRFPTPEQAEAAARELAEWTPPPLPEGSSPRTPVDVKQPGSSATAYNDPDGLYVVDAVTPYQSYVIMQRTAVRSAVKGLRPWVSPEVQTQGLLDRQIRDLDTFEPTPLDKLGDLPMDPTGQMLASTLAALDNQSPANMGAWPAQAWVHFEFDPVTATALFRDNGVDYVSQRRATVYRARDNAAARKLAGALAEQARSEDSVAPARPIRGMPDARCFTRARGGESGTSAISWQRVRWIHKCVAVADRYAYTVFSHDLTDAQQQASAQYRILAGR
jgi:hypothetical protein